MSEHFHEDFQAAAAVPSINGVLRGTLIETPEGGRAVETLKLGDRVATADHGTQTVTSLSRQKVKGTGPHAPVCIAAGAFGNLDTLLVAPQQRILITGWQAELYHGQEEALVEARSLVNGTSVCRIERPTIELFGLGFDDHQLIFANGAGVESDLPYRSQCFEQAIGARGWNANATAAVNPNASAIISAS